MFLSILHLYSIPVRLGLLVEKHLCTLNSSACTLVDMGFGMPGAPRFLHLQVFLPLLLSCPASVGVCVLLALDCFAPKEQGPLPVAEVTAVGDAWPSAVLPLLVSCLAAGLCVLLALACFAPREHGSSPLLPNIFLMPMPSFCCHFAAGFWLVFAPREHGPLPVAEVIAVGAA
ncbi:hypothetical protein U1Q18_047452 [Sarracenia purpurea var. burkii]